MNGYFTEAGITKELGRDSVDTGKDGTSITTNYDGTPKYLDCRHETEKALPGTKLKPNNNSNLSKKNNLAILLQDRKNMPISRNNTTRSDTSKHVDRRDIEAEDTQTKEHADPKPQ